MTSEFLQELCQELTEEGLLQNEITYVNDGCSTESNGHEDIVKCDLAGKEAYLGRLQFVKYGAEKPCLLCGHA